MFQDITKKIDNFKKLNENLKRYYRNKMKNFIRNAINELHNVTWPTRTQAIHSMFTVISIMLLVGLFLGLVDYLFNEAILTALRSKL